MRVEFFKSNITHSIYSTYQNIQEEQIYYHYLQVYADLYVKKVILLCEIIYICCLIESWQGFFGVVLGEIEL